MNKLKEIINTVLLNSSLPEVDSINSSLHLRNNLGMDSIALAELAVRIEDLFDVDVFEDGLVETVGEIIEKLPME
tara:strand:- start:1297 stop:1521 length:225 start_codon:yes stop_codon:yes gene_type:complete